MVMQDTPCFVEGHRIVTRLEKEFSSGESLSAMQLARGVKRGKNNYLDVIREVEEPKLELV